MTDSKVSWRRSKRVVLIATMLCAGGCERETPSPAPQPIAPVVAPEPAEPAVATVAAAPPSVAAPPPIADTALAPAPEGSVYEIPEGQRREFEISARTAEAKKALALANNAANRQFEKEMKLCMQVPADQADNCRTAAQTNHEAMLAAARADHDAAILEAGQAW